MSIKRSVKEPVDHLLSEIGKVPPQAIDLEEAVLGAIMLEKDAYLQVNTILKPEHFYNEANRKIYEAIERQAKKYLPIDILTVTESLRSVGQITEVGGPLFVARLTSRVGSAAHLEEHARIVLQKFIQRELIRVSSEIQRNAFDETEDIKDLLDHANTSINQINEMKSGATGRHISEVVMEAKQAASDRWMLNDSGMMQGINTGFADLNRITNGWQKSDLIILAARPSVGKTSVAIEMAKRSRVNVLFYSLEMKDVKIANRLILSECNDDIVTIDEFKEGRLSENKMKEIYRAGDVIYNLPITIYDDGGINLSYIRSTAQVKKNKGECDLIIVDYIGLMEFEGNNRGTKNDKVGEISKGLKSIAKKLNVPVIALSQLSREIEKENRKPRLSDLRDSGCIEQDADVVLFLSLDNDPNLTQEYGKIIMEFSLQKHRDGKLKDFIVTTNESRTKFYDSNWRNDTIPDGKLAASGELNPEIPAMKLESDFENKPF